MAYTYLLVNVCSVFVPFLFSFHPKLRFDKLFKSFFLSNALVALIFMVWDMYFNAIQVWGFNDRYLLGWRLNGLPMEEMLFFVCIPFACSFTYHCLQLFLKITWRKQFEKIVVWILVLVLLFVGVMNITRAYTASACLSTAGLLLFLKYVAKVNWLPSILSIYPILLIPFFIVNGILTGSWIDEPVVWYNNNENLGIRMGTIPIEDTVYGLELILMNIWLSDYFQHRYFVKENLNTNKHE